jgi:signal transduction histidine kinase
VRPPAWTSRSDAWFAGAAAILSTVIGVLGLATAPGAAARVEVAVLSAVTVAAFLVAGRRRLPTPVLALWTYTPAIVLALRQRGEGTMFLLVVALSFIVLVEPDRWKRIAAGAVAVLTPAGVTLAVHPDWGWPFWTGGIVFGWLSAEQTRRFRGLVAELAATRERLAEQAVDLERRRIAAEVHDLVGHSLGVLLLHVTGARRRVRDDPDAAEQALRQAEGIGRAGLTEIRRSVAALRHQAGTVLAPTPSAAEVPELVARTAAAGSAVSLTVTGELDTVEAIISLAVYRVVQESLVNATRHAAGAPVQVRVAVQQDAVRVTVSDAGAGSPDPPSGAGGVGLVGMRERVEALGGTLDAGPTPTGWQVAARIPRALRVDRPHPPAPSPESEPAAGPDAEPARGPVGGRVGGPDAEPARGPDGGPVGGRAGGWTGRSR